MTTTKNHITFSMTFEIVADFRGIYTVNSGCAPHYPGVNRLVFGNANYQYKLSDEDQQRVKVAADSGSEEKLRNVLRSLFIPVGRASQHDWV